MIITPYTLQPRHPAWFPYTLHPGILPDSLGADCTGAPLRVWKGHIHRVLFPITYSRVLTSINVTTLVPRGPRNGLCNSLSRHIRRWFLMSFWYCTARIILLLPSLRNTDGSYTAAQQHHRHQWHAILRGIFNKTAQWRLKNCFIGSQCCSENFYQLECFSWGNPWCCIAPWISFPASADIA